MDRWYFFSAITGCLSILLIISYPQAGCRFIIDIIQNTKYKIQNSNYQCSTHNLVFPAANTHTLYLRFSSILVLPSAEHSFAFLPSAYALLLLYGKYSIAEKKFLVNRALREKKQSVI